MTLATAIAMLYKDSRSPPSAYQPIANDSNEEAQLSKGEKDSDNSDGENVVKLEDLPLWHIVVEGPPSVLKTFPFKALVIPKSLVIQKAL